MDHIHWVNTATLLITLSFLCILSPAREFQMLPVLSLLLCSSPSLRRHSFSPARESQMLTLPSLLLGSSPCPSLAFFHQNVSFRRFPFHVCCSAHHHAICWHSFSPAREFQTLPWPSLLLCSSPCPSSGFFSPST
jgi:hypothetical protein